MPVYTDGDDCDVRPQPPDCAVVECRDQHETLRAIHDVATPNANSLPYHAADGVSYATDTSSECSQYEYEDKSPEYYTYYYGNNQIPHENGHVSNQHYHAGHQATAFDFSNKASQPKCPKRKRIITFDQRRAANIRERRRMMSLNDSFDLLRKSLPTFSYEKKLSRIETLRLALTYIGFMTDVLNGIGPQDVQLLPLKPPSYCRQDDQEGPASYPL